MKLVVSNERTPKVAENKCPAKGYCAFQQADSNPTQARLAGARGNGENVENNCGQRRKERGVADAQRVKQSSLTTRPPHVQL